MRVLICGSRKWPTPEAGAQVRERLARRINELPKGTIVIEGEAYSIDRWAGEIATRRGLFVAKVPVGQHHWDAHGKGAAILRDHAMLDLLHIPTGADWPKDMVIAFQFEDSRGTQATINEALRRGIWVELHSFDWDGSELVERVVV